MPIAARCCSSVPSEREVVIDPLFMEAQFHRNPSRYVELFAAVKLSEGERLLVHGAVTMVRPGLGFFMVLGDENEWAGNVWVQTTQPINLRINQMVDVLAFAEMSDRKPQLRDAIVHPGKMGLAHAPASPPPGEIARGEHHAELVTLEGLLLEKQHGLQEDSLVLAIGDEVACARCRSGQEVSGCRRCEG